MFACMRSTSYKNFLAMHRLVVFSVVVELQVDHMLFTESLAYAVTKYVKPQCAVKFLACVRPVGKTGMRVGDYLL